MWTCNHFCHTDDDVYDDNIDHHQMASLSGVPETELLDTSANKEKAHLVASSAMARRLPTRHGSGVSEYLSQGL